MDRTAELENLIRSGKRAHLIGIGGVSMSPLASVLVKTIPITGSDIRESAVIEDLRAKGIKIYIGHRAENVSDKVVKLIQSYTGVVNKMVWRKESL